VYDYLTNKQICDMIEPFYLSNDAYGACDKVIEEAYKKWKKEGNVVDDITCVVVFFKSQI